VSDPDALFDPESATAPGEPTYAEALGELEAIVAELEGEAVDVDHLSERVRRAAELVQLLRGRIGNARMEVTRVLAELDAATDGPVDPPGAGGR
jgi:exodeoxyribonuclease VII small subunit